MSAEDWEFPDRQEKREAALRAFVSTKTNTGPVTFNGTVLELKRNGKPLRAGDLISGATYAYDRKTGEVETE